VEDKDNIDDSDDKAEADNAMLLEEIDDDIKDYEE